MMLNPYSHRMQEVNSYYLHELYIKVACVFVKFHMYAAVGGLLHPVYAVHIADIDLFSVPGSLLMFAVWTRCYL